MSPDELNNIVDLALTTPEQFARLRELAREAAVRNHPGHLSANFNTCPHPDCVLVRASAPSVAPCPDPFNETHEHQWVTETRCYRCGVVTAIKDGDHISFSTTGKPNPPKWPESAPSVVEPAKETWQSIDSAPKDGEHFIAWDTQCGLLFTMHWDGERFLTEYERWSGCITHWRPLPAPPAVEAKEPRLSL